MLLGRRALGLAAAGLPLFAIKRAHAAEFGFKFANNLPPLHPLNVRAAEACERIAKATDGRVAITMHPASQLGPDTEVLKKLQAGEVELFTLSGLILSSVVPPASINGIGFAFKTYRQVWGAMDGAMGAFVRGEIGKRGLVAVGRIWDNGFRQTTTSTKAVRSPEDLRGMKLRVPVSPLWTSMFKALGTDPVSLNFSEVYAALQARTAAGQENPLALVQAAKLYEVQTYCSLTNHMWDGFWLLANERVWSGMPGGLRDLVEAEFDRSAQNERDDLLRLNPEQRGDLAMLGMSINPVQSSEFQQVLQQAGFYAEWRGKYGEAAWGLLEDAVGKLA